MRRTLSVDSMHDTVKYTPFELVMKSRVGHTRVCFESLRCSDQSGAQLVVFTQKTKNNRVREYTEPDDPIRINIGRGDAKLEFIFTASKTLPVLLATIQNLCQCADPNQHSRIANVKMKLWSL